jgi:signal transduction histidine kinase
VDSTPSRATTGRRVLLQSRLSLRVRLTAAAGLVILVGMAGAAALLVARLQSSLVANLENAVRQQVETVAANAQRGQLPQPLPSSGEGADLIQVIDSKGGVLTSSANIQTQPRLFHFQPGNSDPSIAGISDLPVGDGNSSTVRAAALSTTSPHGPVTVYAALPTTEISQSVTELTAALAVGVPVITLLLAGVGWLLIGRALRPVESMRLQAAHIPGTDLHRRLRPPPSNDELGRLARTLNELLARIERATSRQKRFVADAAHELRNPLAVIQTQLEVAIRHPSTWSETSTSELLAETQRLSRLVEDLLQLARLDADPQPRQQVVDLDDVVLEQIRRARGRGPSIEISGVSAGRVIGDPDALVRLVQNLLENAIRHTAESITVTLRRVDGDVVLVVADDGPGVPAEDHDRVFERFTRLDNARSRDAGGSGLGLAIVRDVVSSCGGTVRVEDNHPGARFVVSLPSAG